MLNPAYINEPVIVANLGIGVSSDLTKWVLRPEFGCLGTPFFAGLSIA